MNPRSRTSRAAAAAALALCVLLPARPSPAGTVDDPSTVERRRFHNALAWGMGGAVIGFYSAKMRYSFFQRIVPARFTPTEAAFLVGGWLAFLAYTGTGAALSRVGTAQVPAASSEPPTAWPSLGVDESGRAVVGASLRF